MRALRTDYCTLIRGICLPPTITTMSTLILIVVLALATHRATRLLTRDALPLIATPRTRFVNRWAAYDEPEEMKGVAVHPKGTNIFMRSVAYLWECDWCMSVWVGGILTLVTSQLINLPLPWLVWPAVSSITGLIAQRESPTD